MKHKTIFLIIGAVTLVMAAVILISGRLGKTPFSELRTEDIASVTVEITPPGKTAELENITEFVAAVNKVVTYEKDDSYSEYVGQAVVYTIKLKDGRVITVSALNPFVVVDGVGYKADDESCNTLSSIAGKLLG